MNCLIIAAGMGSRLQHRGKSKPLIPILGIPMIERIIHTACEVGVDEFYVVTGYQGHQVRNFLVRLEKRLAIRITPLVNEDWEKEMGLTATFPKGERNRQAHRPRRGGAGAPAGEVIQESVNSDQDNQRLSDPEPMLHESPIY